MTSRRGPSPPSPVPAVGSATPITPTWTCSAISTGPGTLSWRLQLTLVDRLVEQLAAQLPRDAVLAVTGDHGVVAMDRTIDADTHPHLRHGLALLGGDPRARHAYAVPGVAADLLATWGEVLGDTAWTVSREQAVDEGHSALSGRTSPHASATSSPRPAAAAESSARSRSRSCRASWASTGRSRPRSSSYPS